MLPCNSYHHHRLTFFNQKWRRVASLSRFPLQRERLTRPGRSKLQSLSLNRNRYRCHERWINASSGKHKENKSSGRLSHFACDGEINFARKFSRFSITRHDSKFYNSLDFISLAFACGGARASWFRFFLACLGGNISCFPWGEQTQERSNAKKKEKERENQPLDIFQCAAAFTAAVCLCVSICEKRRIGYLGKGQWSFIRVLDLCLFRYDSLPF